MKNVLIVGGNFKNKGAQSMLFVTMNEIYNRFPTSNIYINSYEENDLTNYKLINICMNRSTKEFALASGLNRMLILFKSYLKDVIKFILGKRKYLWQTIKVNNILKKIDLIIDISGFSLGNKWTINEQENYLDNIRIAKKYNIPMILMPQSFGPFEYEVNKQYFIDELKEVLSYPRIIYAREKNGFEWLHDKFKLENVVRSCDLVLQNKKIDLNNIFYNVPKNNIPVIDKNSVAIVPNNQCFMHGTSDKIYELYERIIKLILESEKKVYIFRHSYEDLEHCIKIKERFKDNDKVILLENDFTCFEYNELVKNFDFIVCSRFHGVVHAYKNAIPSIVLGWAIKYKELTELFEQQKYMSSIIDENINMDNILESVKLMLQKYETESKLIQAKLKEVQSNNCYDILDEF